VNRTIDGWLLDVYPARRTMVVWIATAAGEVLRFEDPFRPSIYAQGRRRDLEAMAERFVENRFCDSAVWTEKKEFWSDKPLEVMELRVSDYGRIWRLLDRLTTLEGRFTFYNCDIPLPQYYLYVRGLVPMVRCRAECRGDRVVSIRSTASPWDDKPEIPPLRRMEMSITGDPHLPLGRNNGLRVRADETEIEYDAASGTEMLEHLNRLISCYDPDLIVTAHGDSCIVPSLLRLSRKLGVPLVLDRDPAPVLRKITTRGKSFFSYGRILYKGPSYPLYGRLHIDRHNSFIYKEAGLDGVLEFSRLGKMPVQYAARTSPGTAISSMQVAYAVEHDILVPWRKGEPEQFKSAWHLLKTDKGGLTFRPPIGLHRDVAELDFASMYPSIMVRHNISPETVLCSCCPEPRVPEIGYNVCRRRRGMVPQVLEPILARRERFKSLAASSDDPAESALYDKLQTSLKWVLVTCFGYLGYKNARFGRIEAHEAVTAFGREMLLKAKELCERRGFRVLHGMTDSLWIQKPGISRQELEPLQQIISRDAGVEIRLEGVYRFIVFLPSKTSRTRPVPNRLFGIFDDGTIKVRGLACRKRDTPPFIREMQGRMLARLAGAELGDRLADELGAIEQIVCESAEQLLEGNVDKTDLIITRRPLREAGTYKNANRTALAMDQLLRAGIRLAPGEKLGYLLCDAHATVKEDRVRPAQLLGPEDGYDSDEYLRLLLDAAEEVLLFFGYDRAQLEEKIRPRDDSRLPKVQELDFARSAVS